MTATDLVLRPAGPADADAVADVHLAARAAAPMPPSVHPEPEVRAWLASRLDGAARVDADETWVAELAESTGLTGLTGLTGRVVGYARFTATWLDDLYVHPAHAGTGIGSALLDLVKARRPHGFGLWVFETNEPARRFYAGRGAGRARAHRRVGQRGAGTGRPDGVARPADRDLTTASPKPLRRGARDGRLGGMTTWSESSGATGAAGSPEDAAAEAARGRTALGFAGALLAVLLVVVLGSRTELAPHLRPVRRGRHVRRQDLRPRPAVRRHDDARAVPRYVRAGRGAARRTVPSSTTTATRGRAMRCAPTPTPAPPTAATCGPAGPRRRCRSCRSG
ncbi:GNAT family N-acetyltransferase [Nocardioides sp. TF02-7]|uniref:GNAT family N-acetyltransferase n=1 Tax=Nocardioides sp. TF02-7 TaxID=2917724 RepID=UPI001F0608B6|nr:GNAT family N-acetyltransferase [Nocardioides sp. TF02-7]UMG92114.1 GNAT family N-acetyltransferase [Nocardioides sp. TF02-7]